MAAEKDVSRDARKTGLILAGGLFVVIALGFLAISWLNTPEPQPSRISVDRVSRASGTAVQETQQYRELLKESNDAGAAHALQTNGSFIASMSMADHEPEPPPPPAPAAAPPVQVVQQVQYVPAGLDPEKKKAVENFLVELSAQRKPAVGRSAVVAGGVAVQGGAGNAGEWSAWTESLKPQTSQMMTAGVSTQEPVQILIPAGARPGGTIDTEVDSDNTRTQVLASIPAGPYAGAQLMASGVQLAGDGVSIHFTRMQWKGDMWDVDAHAAMPDTLKSSVATTVNNRYMTRIVLPSLANGVGLGGQLYASANTQILSNGYNNIEGRVGMPDGKAVAGTIIGGTAQQAGQVIAADAQRLPVKQVLVERGQTVAILFMNAVKSTDNITRSAGGSLSSSLSGQ